MATTEEHGETVGLLADRIDNLIHASVLPLPPEFHLAQIVPALEEIRDELRAAVVDMTGENPWA